MDPVHLQTLSPAAITRAGARKTNQLDSQDFFKLLITELQQQDPLKPQDSSHLVQEVSQIRQMDLSTKLDSTLSNFAAQQRIGGATNMIGRYVSGVITSGTSGATAQVQGIVVGVTFSESGEAILELHNGARLPVKDVRAVALVDPNTGGPLLPGSGGTTPAGTTPPATGGSTPAAPPAGTPSIQPAPPRPVSVAA